jgi:hypothetical protein
MTSGASLSDTDGLTPYNTVLLEKLTVAQLVKKVPAFHGTRRFITVFTRARHLFISWVRRIQFTPSNPISLRSILLILSLQSAAGSSERHLPFKLSDAKMVHIFNLSNACYMHRLSRSPWFDQPNIIWKRVQIMTIQIKLFFSILSSFSFFRSRHSQLLFNNLQPLLLPQSKKEGRTKGRADYILEILHTFQFKIFCLPVPCLKTKD